MKVAGPALILGGGEWWRGKIGELAYIRKTEYLQEEFLSEAFVGTPTAFSVKVAGPALILGGGEWWRGKIGELAYIRKNEYLQEEFLLPLCRNSDITFTSPEVKP